MKTKHCLTLTLLVAFNQLSSQPSVMYPLHTGNLWVYDQYNITREVIKDTVMSDGLTYSIICEKMGGLSPYNHFQRQSGDSIFHIRFGQEQLLYDFSCLPGDTVVSIPIGTDTTDIILTWSGTVNLFGRTLRQWKFFLDCYRLAFDDEEYHTITDSIGLTSWMEFMYGYNLRGAIINGIQYGTITNAKTDQDMAPKYFSLKQNYPNPFNLNTTIEFSLFDSEYLKLIVYNLSGKVAITLFSGKLAPGKYKFGWNAENLADGIYLYQIQTAYFSQTRKMLLYK